MNPLSIGDVIWEPERMPLLISGPCVLEDEDEAMRIASACVELADEFDFLYEFKSSYLKDNRSSVDSYTGPGLEKGLGMLERIRTETGVPILTGTDTGTDGALPEHIHRELELVVEAVQLKLVRGREVELGV